MKIRILSDLHIEFEGFSLDTSGCDIVILAGDTHLREKGVTWLLQQDVAIPVLYVLGNHEYYRATYPKLIGKLKDQCAGTNVSILENDSLRIGDVTFFGCTLWTDFELFGDPLVAGMECQLSSDN